VTAREVKIRRLPFAVAKGAFTWGVMPKTPDTGGQVTDGSILEAEKLYTARSKRAERQRVAQEGKQIVAERREREEARAASLAELKRRAAIFELAAKRDKP